MIPSTIAMDGPAASGKSTVSETLAQRLGYLYFDTGAMYRAVTWAALQQGIVLENEKLVTTLAQALRIDLQAPTVEDGRQYTVLVDGTDVTWQLRSPAVNENVSTVSAYPGVREAMVRQQRRVASKGQVVMVGRDIGTVVLPDADLKIYLDASLEERARRRWAEVQARGEAADYGDILASMQHRDQVDSHREVSPLRVAEDAVVVDTTAMDIDQVVDQLVALVEAWECPQA